MKNFDTVSFLKDYGIEYRTAGKNVTSGWVEIRCPICNDPSMHCGISPTGGYNCWRCGGGSLEQLLEVLCTREKLDVQKTLQKYTTVEQIVTTNKRRGIQSRKIQLPNEADKVFYETHYNYLINRRFNPETIIKDYDLYVTHNVGDYKFRFILPIYMEERIVSFTGLDFTKKQSPKYLNAKDNMSIISVKDCLYNIDSCHDKCIIVEGPVDVWRWGIGSIATFGTQFTSRQVYEIVKRDFSEIFIMYDGEPHAQKQAKKLANFLCGNHSKVEIIELPIGQDPDDQSDETVISFKSELKIF